MDRESYIQEFVRNLDPVVLAERDLQVQELLADLEQPLRARGLRLVDGASLPPRYGYRRVLLILEERVPSELTFECTQDAAHGVQPVVEIVGNGTVEYYQLACGHAAEEPQ